MSASSSVYVACPKLVDTCRPLQASATRSYLQRAASELESHGHAQVSSLRRPQLPPSQAHIACKWRGQQNHGPLRQCSCRGMGTGSHACAASSSLSKPPRYSCRPFSHSDASHRFVNLRMKHNDGVGGIACTSECIGYATSTGCGCVRSPREPNALACAG